MLGLGSQKKIIADEKTISELLSRGVAEVVEHKELEKMLRSGKTLRVKLGIDPTSPDIHIGRAVVLRKLKVLQDAGHKVILIVGDFTGEIGDTSDKENERPVLSPEEVKRNLRTYFDQMGKIIDLSRAEKHYNSKWLSKLSYKEICLQADQFSLSDFIDRELIKRRLEKGTRISLREVLYPLMQGYDSVAVKADIEVGGTDQRFNILSGRPIQAHYGQKPQQMILLKLLPGLDGRKMSSSWGNTINITDTPEQMYGKTMSLKDEFIATYFELATEIKLEEVNNIKNALEAGSLHPKDAKMRLGREIVSLYHGSAAAGEAESNFIKTFVEGGVPKDIPEVFFNEGDLLGKVSVASGAVPSMSEFQRLVEGGAIEIVGGEKIKDPRALTREATYRIGKHRFIKTKKK